MYNHSTFEIGLTYSFFIILSSFIYLATSFIFGALLLESLLGNKPNTFKYTLLFGIITTPVWGGSIYIIGYAIFLVISFIGYLGGLL